MEFSQDIITLILAILAAAISAYQEWRHRKEVKPLLEDIKNNGE